MVVGVGVDLLEIARMTRELRGRDPGLREELFTPAEVACCEAARDPMARYAERFAAKEAVFKALAPPPGRGGSWRDVEVRPHGRGGEVLLHGAMKARAEALGVRRIRLSLSRTRGLAMASVVLDG
jgi:phosphopantetheine--protein transferase-like protein